MIRKTCKILPRSLSKNTNPKVPAKRGVEGWLNRSRDNINAMYSTAKNNTDHKAL